jgi:esterase/lipase superfamily enzyme
MRILAKAPQVLAGCALCLVAACGPNVYDEIDLMPAPTIYSEGGLDPFRNVSEKNLMARTELFYATDRMPSRSDDPQAFYNNERGQLLRAGVARVRADPPFESWEEIRRITMASDRNSAYTLRLSNVSEIGVMPFSVTDYMTNPPSRGDMELAGRQFASRIDRHLASSANKDIFIYVHGYNVDFDYSTLVSKELQHFLGYQGAFISYNWTATPSQLAYFRDQESAMASRRYLRSLIEFLSRRTSADRIHLVGYSAGSRLAFETAYQIALQGDPDLRLGRLILISSDLDRAFFLQAIADGLLNAADDITLYQSQTDAALALSRLVFGRKRLGEAPVDGEVEPLVQSKLAGIENLHIIDVTAAEKADAGNGHWYFQSSPWASSDLLLSLLTDRGPAERGLVRRPGEAIWRFPANYPEVIRNVLTASSW